MKDYTNEARVRGTIVGINRSAKETVVNLVCKSNGIRNYPMVCFPNSEMVDGYNVGDNIIVFGYVQNHIVKKDNGKNGSKVTFIGERIYPAVRLLADYFPMEELPSYEGGFADDRSEVVFIGDVVMLYAPEGRDFAIVKAACKSKEHKGQCDMTCFARLSSMAREISVGDKIAAVGYFATENKTIEGQRTVAMNIICKDICKLN